jgi:hypothetical protein
MATAASKTGSHGLRRSLLTFAGAAWISSLTEAQSAQHANDRGETMKGRDQISPQPAPSLATALVGAWQLESTVQRLVDGTERPSPLYGQNGTGYLIYSSSGHMSATLADPRRERWVDEDEPTEEDLRELHAHFIAYCGRYEVDEGAGLVRHRLELHVTPNLIGSVLVRRAKVEGSRLVLRPIQEELPKGMLEYTLTWRRT